MVFLQPGESAAYAPAFGATVTSATGDWKPSLRALIDTNAYLARRDCGDAAKIDDDSFYVHFQAAGSTAPSKVAAGDIRVAVAGSSGSCSPPAAGLVVASGDNDFDATITSPEEDTTFQTFESYVKYLEMDGAQGFTKGDALILDFGGVAIADCANEAVGFSECDLRLTPILTLGAGTLVKAGDADLVEFADTDGNFPDAAFDAASAGAVTLRYFDANENLALDKGSPADTVYARLAAGAPTVFTGPANHAANVPVLMDLRLTAFGTDGFGTLAAQGDDDLVPILDAVPANRLVCYPKSACGQGFGLSTARLLLNFDTGTTKRVQVGDLILNAPGGTPGSLVTGASNGAGNEFNVSNTAFADSLFYVDIAPAGLGDEDPVYLNRPADLGGGSDVSPNFRVSTNDVRIYVPPGGTGAPGGVVGSTDADLTSYQGTNGKGVTFVKWFDGSRGQPLGGLRATAKDTTRVSGNDGAWNAGELVYSSGSTTALTSPVAVGQIRVTPVSYGKASAVLCTNMENADCGDDVTVAPVAGTTIRISGADTSFASDEDAYLSSGTSVSNGDRRLTPKGTQAIGYQLECPGDPSGDCGTPLMVASNACMTGNDMSWTQGEIAYQRAASACPANVAGSDMSRMTPVSLPGSTAVAATEPDVGLVTRAETPGTFKITGTNNVFSAGTDFMYVSANLLIDSGDTRITNVSQSKTPTALPDLASGTVVASGDSDVNAGLSTGDALYLSPVALADSRFPVLYDVRLRAYNAQAYGSRVGAGMVDFTPRVLTFQAAAANDATFCLTRNDRGEATRVNDDAFYIGRSCGSDTVTVAVGDGRLTLVTGTSLAAGSIVQKGEADVGSTNTRAANFFSQVRYVDGPSSKATKVLDSGDLVYVEQTLGAAGDSKLGANDIRLKTTVGLSTNYNAGTFVDATNVDASTFTTTAAFHTDPDEGCSASSATTCPTNAIRGKFIDKNGNGTWDPGEHLLLTGQDDGDCSARACSAILRLGDVFLTGSGGGTGITSPPPTTTTPTTPAPVLATLTKSKVKPTTCVAAGTSLTVSVVYTDSLNRAPTTSKVTINSVDTPMTGSGTAYNAGVNYSATVNAPSTPNTYATTFTFVNAGGTVTAGGPPIGVVTTASVAPSLSASSVSPTSGFPGEPFTWSVTYADLNNDTPTVKKVMIDGTAHDMTTSDTIYCDGSVFTYQQAVAEGDHSYAFEFKDAAHAAVRLPETGSLPGPLILKPETTAPTTSNQTGPPKVTYPKKSTPGFEVAGLAFAALVAVAVMAARRRK